MLQNIKEALFEAEIFPYLKSNLKYKLNTMLLSILQSLKRTNEREIKCYLTTDVEVKLEKDEINIAFWNNSNTQQIISVEFHRNLKKVFRIWQ